MTLPSLTALQPWFTTCGCSKFQKQSPNRLQYGSARWDMYVESLTPKQFPQSPTFCPVVSSFPVRVSHMYDWAIQSSLIPYLLNSSIDHITSYLHRLFLSKSQSPGYSLVLYTGIPLRFDNEYTVRRCEIQSATSQPEVTIHWQWWAYPTAPVPVVMIKTRKRGFLAKSSSIFSRFDVGQSPSMRR